MSKAAQFRSLLERGSLIVAPGAIDCITARAIAHAGFPVAYMTGGGTSMSMGYPDYGLVTMTEMVANASRIANSIDIPLISDSDTGYGNELNVFRTVQEFERAGVAAIHLEDQAFPKTCSYVESRKLELASREDYVAKIRAAAAARRSKEFCIIARTDACGVAGLDEAVERANLALSGGADIAYLDGLKTMADVEAVPKRVKGRCLVDMSFSNVTPEFTLAVAEQFGYGVAIVPGAVLSGIFEICDERLADLKQGKLPAPGAASPSTLFARFGAADWDARRTAFRDPADAAE